MGIILCGVTDEIIENLSTDSFNRHPTLELASEISSITMTAALLEHEVTLTDDVGSSNAQLERREVSDAIDVVLGPREEAHIRKPRSPSSSTGASPVPSPSRRHPRPLLSLPQQSPGSPQLPPMMITPPSRVESVSKQHHIKKKRRNWLKSFFWREKHSLRN